MVTKLASAILNDITSGYAGAAGLSALSMSQLEDDVVDEYLQIIKEYSLKGIIPKKDLLMSLNCIDLDCESLDKCPCGTDYSPAQLHFEIPQIFNDFNECGVEYIGAIDKSQPYKIYFDPISFKYHKYKRRGAEKPYVFIDTTPNKNNLYDCWIFNAPFTKKISVIAIFKDPRQLTEFGCCTGDDIENYTFLYTEIKKRLTEKKLRYYRQFLEQPTPNDQVYR